MKCVVCDRKVKLRRFPQTEEFYCSEQCLIDLAFTKGYRAGKNDVMAMNDCDNKTGD